LIGENDLEDSMNDETVAMIIVLPTIVVVMAWAF
jgi:hypothetical protein